MNRPSGLPVGSEAGSLQPVRLRARRLLNSLLDVIYPPQCIGCQRYAGSLLCPACQSKISPAPAAAEPASPLAGRRATAHYGPIIQRAIHELKYNRKHAIADVLAQRLLNELARTDWQPTMITATPLHTNRQRERGYNQAELLARYVALASGLPFRAGALVRTRDTRSQVGLGLRERQQNMAGAFFAEPDVVKGQRIVIIDDVYTTGATLRACASALLEAGANTVWALTVASAGVGADAPPDF